MGFFSREESTDVELQMTPMIDIVFLLNIFFMCTTQFHMEAELDLNLPPEMQADVAALNVPIKVEVNGDGEILFYDEKVDGDRLAAFLLKANESRPKKDLPVAIFGDPDCRHQSVVHVLDACARAGVWNVSVATFGETGPPGSGG